jgi:hypothetical protein
MAPNKDTTGLTEVNLGIPYDNEFPVAQAAVVDVVAPTNLPTVPAELDLWDMKEGFLFSVFTTVLVEPTAAKIIRRYSEYGTSEFGKSHEAGYQFNVETGNGPALLVKVPNGGAVAGQRFAAEVIDREGSPSDLNIKTNPHNIPTGH